MSDRSDPAWEEYLTTGVDPTGGELCAYECEDEASKDEES